VGARAAKERLAWGAEDEEKMPQIPEDAERRPLRFAPEAYPLHRRESPLL
jgi:hypothetical protein